MINNNAFEVDPSPRKKRKRSLQCTNAYMNPALDILSTEDTMCNNFMEVAPSKRTRRSQSCESRISFENHALDLPTKAYNELLRKELANVNEKLTSITEMPSPAYQNAYYNNESALSMAEEKSIILRSNDNTRQVNSTPVVSGNSIVKRRASFDLSFIEKLGIDDSVNGEALYLDDDLNESNIMEIKTITTITMKKLQRDNVAPKNTNPFLNCNLYYNAIEKAPVESKSNFPFDIQVQSTNCTENDSISSSSAYEVMSEPEIDSITSIDDIVMPRRLFADDDSSIQYIDDQSIADDNKKFQHSAGNNNPINCNFSSTSYRDKPVFVFEGMNKQSKILGCDVTNISQNEIFNGELNSVHTKRVCIPNLNNNIEATFKDNSNNRIEAFKNQPAKSNNKISSKIFNKIKGVFKPDKKSVPKNENLPVNNPYEVVRRAPVQEKSKKPLPVCFVNPALNLNTTAEMECDEVDNEMMKSMYSTASGYNNRNPFQITPMKQARENQMLYDKENLYTSQTMSNGVDLSDICYQSENMGKKHVRFDSTLNHEKVITGNSFDSEHNSVSSSGSSQSSNQVTQVFHQIDSEIDEFHNELENCFNEKKFITQNL